MSSDPQASSNERRSDSSLVFRQLPEWRETLLNSSVELGPSDLTGADAAGLQLLLSALLESDGRLKLNLEGLKTDSLWSRLGMDDLADAQPVFEGDRLVGLRPLVAVSG